MKMKPIKKKIAALAAFCALTAIVVTGCGSTASNLTGEIKIDGSSTVFPITEAVAEEFGLKNPDLKIPIGVSGTGGGFTKFAAKEIDIADASRKIKDAEKASLEAAGIEYLELKVGFDGLSIVVNKNNTWVDTLTVDQLKLIFAPGSTVKTWKDVNPSWPAEEIKIYAPGTDSGTFDYFTETVNGKSGSMRTDFTASEDDNVLVQGISGNKNALGFFGYSYYAENKDKLKVVKIDAGKGAVTPTFDTIKDGTYAPFSRPLYIYVNKASLEREEVKEFVKFYLENAKELVSEVGYVALPDADYESQLDLLK